MRPQFILNFCLRTKKNNNDLPNNYYFDVVSKSTKKEILKEFYLMFPELKVLKIRMFKSNFKKKVVLVTDKPITEFKELENNKE